MRYVERVGPVLMKDPVSGEVTEDKWSIHRFLVAVVLPDPAFGKGFEADRARVAVEKAARCNPKTLALEDDHWDRCCSAIKEPKGDFNPYARMQLFPYQEAIVEAKKEKK